MKKTLLLLIILSSFLQANSQWTYLGLSSTSTTDLTIHGDTIYASTQDGIYKKHVLTNDSNWVPCGMQGVHVVQTLVPNYQHFICELEVSPFRAVLVQSLDGGITFNALLPDTSNIFGYPYLDAIAHPPGNYDTLYLENHRKKTYDGGLTWDTLPAYQLTDNFIAIPPDPPHRVIVAGETFILSPYLQISSDFGNTWSIPSMNGYFLGDNAILDFAFDGDEWFAAGEGVVCKTTDGGNTWDQLFNFWSGPVSFSLYNNDIEMSPADKNKLYVSGSNGYPINVPLLYSPDKGLTWDTLSTPTVNGNNPGITCLAVQNTSSGDRVFLGGEGIYLYENLFTGIGETDPIKISIFPNPVENELRINIPGSKEASVNIFDQLGKIVLRKEVSGENCIINLSNLANQVYVLEITSGNRSFRQKILKF